MNLGAPRDHDERRTSVDNGANIKHFITLVRLGIGHQGDTDLENVDWNAIEELAKRQKLLAVVYDGVNRLTGLDRPPQLIWLRWIGELMQGYEQRYVAYRNAIADLGSFYSKHGFRMMLLKGLACGMNWPQPEHRPYGDIDIYQFGLYKQADTALQRELGIKIDHSHHHHTVFQWHGFTVENHYDFVNVHVHRSSRELEDIFKSLADSAENVEICLPPANLHALFLVRHMVSHFTGAEMSLRQLLDWGFFVEKHHTEVDWDWLVEVLKKYHMRELFDVVNAICVEDFGFHLSIQTSKHYTLEAQLKQRVLDDCLNPEFSEKAPKSIWKRVPFKYRRWKSNRWKRELCYDDSQWRTFLSGVWNHILKPAGI